MGQTETVEFLSSGQAFLSPEPVKVVETHGAYVFLCGDTALKLKRAVKYDYMDLSTIEKRREMIARELELNHAFAPEIYRDLLPVTQGRGGMTLGGDGPVVDWVLRMWRFPEESELEIIAERGNFDDPLADATGKAVFDYHALAPLRIQSGRKLIGDIIGELDRVFGEFPDAEGTERVAEWLATVADALERVGAILDTRGQDGHVRRAHGDLHLRNLVLIDGRSVPFDALEFDETLGTCDVLYDIAFLVMDLCHRELQRQACRTLDAWLREARGAEDTGLVALPLFLSVRAAIRAMVILQTDRALQVPNSNAAEVGAYLDLARAALQPRPPVLIALGGFSGSGKSVLARALAPMIGALPGAVILNSDQERKAGLPQDAKLDPEDYCVDRREAIYHAMFDRAEHILSSGHSVILDATFINDGLRVKAREVANRTNVPFHGLWLEAPHGVLEARLRDRTGDVSDADTTVLNKQLSADLGTLKWHVIDAAANSNEVESQAIKRLQAAIRS